jgi:outer membrane protein TolC
MRFSEWQTAVASRKVAAEAVDFQTEQVRVSEQMCNFGKVPAFDVLRNRAALAARQQDLTSAGAEVAAAKARVAQVLATAVDTFSEPANEQRAPLPEDLVGAALAKRPDLAAASLSVDRAQAVVTARKGSYKPQVYGVGMADLSAPANMGTSAGLTVGVVVGVPLVDAGRRRAEVDEAEQDVLRAKAAVAALELQVKADVTAAQARLGAALQNTAAAQAQVTAATEGYRVAQIRYQAEKSTVVELLDSLQALTEARQAAVKAKAGVIAAYAEMYRALGVVAPGREWEPPQPAGPR